ncbi:hypothetical protein Tco_0492701 [Tanacetum coccineum]
MNLICSENISLCDCEDKREVMEKDNEAVVLDMNIKIADAVKPRVGADVNDAVTLDEIKDMKNVFDMYNKRRVGDLYGVESNISELGTTDASYRHKMVNELEDLEDCETEVLKYLPIPARVTFVSFVRNLNVRPKLCVFSNRPDMVARVFRAKVEDVKKLLFKRIFSERSFYEQHGMSYNLSGPFTSQLSEIVKRTHRYPKSIKEARGYPTEQVIGELNERTLRSKTKQA